MNKVLILTHENQISLNLHSISCDLTSVPSVEVYTLIEYGRRKQTLAGSDDNAQNTQGTYSWHCCWVNARLMLG